MTFILTEGEGERPLGASPDRPEWATRTKWSDNGTRYAGRFHSTLVEIGNHFFRKMMPPENIFICKSKPMPRTRPLEANEQLQKLIKTKEQSFYKVIGKLMEDNFKSRLQEEPEAALKAQLEDMGVTEGSMCYKPMYELCLEHITEHMAKKQRNDSTHVFLTINPRPEVEFYQFRKVIDKLLSKVWMTDYLYSIEQRGTIQEDNLGKGMHMHILFRKNDKEPCKIIREVQNTCKKIVGNPQHCNLQFRTADKSKGYVNYIKGDKKDENKHEKCRGDVVWRKKMGIEPHYEKGTIFQS